MPTDLVLRELTETDQSIFLECSRDWVGEDPHWYSFIWRPGYDFHQMLHILRNEKAGIGLAPERVPHTMLYAFVDGLIVGRVSVRHSLNAELKRRGGHVG